MSAHIYLDNSTITRPSSKVVSEMLPFLQERWEASGAPHKLGHEALPDIERALKKIYRLLGAGEEDVMVVTSSGTEAVNHVVQSVYRDVTLPTGKNHFLTSNIDEAPAIMAMSHLEPLGCVCRMVEAGPSGQITAEAVGDALTPRSALLSLSWANGLTGVIHPVEEIAALCRERGILFHLDASHVLGKLYFELDKVGADFITFEGSLLHAPKGTGALWAREGTKVTPLLFGSHEQGGQRAGPWSVAGLAALGQAADQLLEARDLLCMEGARLKSRLEEGIVKVYPDAKVLFSNQERLPHVTAVAFPGIAAEALLLALSEEGLYASIGGGSHQQLSLILEACGCDPLLCHSAISFSLSRETTDHEIDSALKVIEEAAGRLRKTSAQMVTL